MLSDDQLEKAATCAKQLGKARNADVCIYNGPIRRLADIELIQTLALHKQHDCVKR